jgi:hypothetical protein
MMHVIEGRERGRGQGKWREGEKEDRGGMVREKWGSGLSFGGKGGGGGGRGGG